MHWQCVIAKKCYKPAGHQLNRRLYTVKITAWLSAPHHASALIETQTLEGTTSPAVTDHTLNAGRM
jgi:hypothetical protein